MTASCSTCPFRHETSEGALQCIRLPPSPDPIQRFAVWPVVKPGQVCAEHPAFTPAPPPPAPTRAQADMLPL